MEGGNSGFGVPLKERGGWFIQLIRRGGGEISVRIGRCDGGG